MSIPIITNYIVYGDDALCVIRLIYIKLRNPEGRPAVVRKQLKLSCQLCAKA